MSIPSELKTQGEYATRETARTAAKYISDRPLTAVAIAAALGFLVTWLVM